MCKYLSYVFQVLCIYSEEFVDQTLRSYASVV